ncbi:MAG: cyclic nucleotide-binding domain-containing protein [Acidobacteriota bacterium]
MPASAILRSALSALGLLLALEIAYVVLRRSSPRYRLRLLYHLWAVSLAGVGALLALGRDMVRVTVFDLTVTAAALLTTIVVFSLFEALVLVRPWDPKRGPYVPKLVRDSVRLSLVAVVALVLAHTLFGQPLDKLLLSSTALLAVIGLALQDVMKNLFAGVSLQSERAFQVGDWLMLDGVGLAQVQEMTWRATRLRTNDGLEIVEPNSTIAADRLIAYGSGRKPVAFAPRIGLPYALPPAEAKAILLAAMRDAPGIAQTPPPEVFLESYGDSSIVYRLRAWTHQVAGASRFQDGLLARVWYAVQRAGYSFPFPTRTVEMHDSTQETVRAGEDARARAMALLADLPLFHELPAEALGRLAAAARRVHFDDQEILVREGASGDSLFVIEQGHVLVTMSGDEVKTTAIPLARLGPGNFFGEMSLLTGEPRRATVTADGGCVVLMLERQEVAPVLASDPAIAEALSRSLAEREADTAAKLEDRRGRQRAAPAQSQANFLRRIREFFSLPEA